MSNTYILSIETATPVCSVSIANHGVAILSRKADAVNMHANSLTLLIQDLMVDCQINFDQLAAVAVSMGPGSYTGLRIGVSVAKGLCYANDIQLVAVNSLEAMYRGYLSQSKAPDGKILYCPMIDARRQEVYTAFFDASGCQVQETQALIVDATSFDTYIQEGYQMVLFGSGADKFQQLFADQPAVLVHSGFESLAQFQNEIAFEKYQKQQVEDVAYFEPFYLKDFVATKPKKPIL